jgi:hypothetical protein
MLKYRAFLKLLGALVLLTAPWLNPAASAADKEAKKEGGKVTGILIDKKDDRISVKADGEDEPVEYLTGDASDKKLAEGLKILFTVSRVQLTYKTEGESRKLVSIKRHVPKATGKVTGEVVKNYGWWIEVKPKNGVSDGYACNFPFDKNKDVMEQLKELQEGDSVTIEFTTDSERHRIQSLRKNAMPARKDASKDGGKVAGILIDRSEDWITVKADGEDEPVKYVVDVSDKKLQEAFKAVFNASRVQLTYKQVGDSRQLVSIKRQILKESGTVTGVVVKVYNDFWVEVKPKNGVANAFAPGADNYNDKAFMEKLRGLKPRDSVTITFTTDFERHRITSLRKNAASQSKSSSGTPPKK